MRKERGFTIPEILVSLVVFMIIIGSIIPFFQKIYEFYQDLTMKEQLNQAKKNIEDFYRANIFRINSKLMDDLWGFYVEDGKGNKYPTVAIPYGLGSNKYFYSYLQHLPPYQSSGLSVGGVDVIAADGPGNPSGLLMFMSKPYDGSMSNIRVYITPLMRDVTNQFSYRDIYLVWRKNSDKPIQSKIVNVNGELYMEKNRWYLECDPSEYCVKIDGYLITSEVWKKTVEQLTNIANKLTKYAEEKYAADPTKNALMYYFANSDSNGKNSSNCDSGSASCYFSDQSEIVNTCRINGHYTDSFNEYHNNGGYNIRFSDYGLGNDNCFVELYKNELYKSNIPLIASFEAINPTGAPILFDNGGKSVRNPENLGTGNLSGYNAILFTCISDNSCIVYRISQ